MSLWSDGEAQERFVGEVKENLVTLEAQLGGKRFFGSDALGIVDVASCFLAHWLYAMEEAAGVRLFTDGEFPDLRRWAKEYTSHEAVKRSLPDRGQLVAFFSANKERFGSMVKAAVTRSIGARLALRLPLPILVHFCFSSKD
jgi:glutathione S-transferase